MEKRLPLRSVSMWLAVSKCKEIPSLPIEIAVFQAIDSVHTLQIRANLIHASHSRNRHILDFFHAVRS